MTNEHRRLEEAHARDRRMEKVGAVPQRAPVGHRARGLQRERRRLELLHPRPGPLARLPLGRGRPRRHLRRPAASLLRAGALERQGPDPQGAAVRADQQRGQPRRGREGVLLLPRQHADPLVHEVPLQVPPGGLSLRRPGGDEPPAHPRRDGVRAARHRRLRRRPLLRRLRRVRQGARPKTSWSASRRSTAGPDAAELHLLPTLWFRNDWSTWIAESNRAAEKPHLKQIEAPAGATAVAATHPAAGCIRPVVRRRGAAALHRERNQQRAALSGTDERRAPTSRTASTTTWSTAGRRR